MAKHGKSYTEARNRYDREREYEPVEAIALIKQALGLEKGSAEPHKTKVAKLTNAQLTAIAEKKMTDLNANDIDAAKKIIAGTARSMGVEVV